MNGIIYGVYNQCEPTTFSMVELNSLLTYLVALQAQVAILNKNKGEING